MKKLLFVFALMLGAVSCNDTENPTPETRPLTETELRVRGLIEQSADFDPSQVVSMLKGKLLILDSFFEYDSDWQRIIAEPYAFGVQNDPEFEADRYLLREDMTAVRYTWEKSGWKPTEGTWSYDDSTHTLQIVDTEVSIVGLTRVSTIWDKETTNIPGGKPRCYRIIYKVSDYDPNQPNPTPDTVYEPLIVEIMSAAQYFERRHMVQYREGRHMPLMFILVKTKEEYSFFDENNLYVWAEDESGNYIPFAEGLYFNGDFYPMLKAEHAYWGADVKAPYYGYQFFAFWFPGLGDTIFKLRLYNPETKIYYETEWFKGTLTEIGPDNNDYINGYDMYVDVYINKLQ